MTGEKPGSINSMAAESGRDPRDPSVLADFTNALGQWRRQWLEEELIVEGIVGRYLDRHLAGSASGRTTPLMPLEGGWQPGEEAATGEQGLLHDEAPRMTPIPEERHSCDH